MAKDNLASAKSAKNDEFYTQYPDIEREMSAYLEFDRDVFRGKAVLLPCDDPEWSSFTRYFAQNFERLGLRRLTSTSYAPPTALRRHPVSPREVSSARSDSAENLTHGKVFTLTRDVSGDARIDSGDLEWDYLEGDGDFRGAEVTKLRDEADIIVTNPPFSLFREFLAWLMNGGKRFVVIGNMNAITYKEVFRQIKADAVWLGATANGSDMVFAVPPGATVAESDRQKAARLGFVGDFTRLGNSCWFTNVEHGRRHEPLSLMTMEDNLRFSRHKEIRGRTAYARYDNYDAIEVPFTDAIPSDYPGVMGVPISFLAKYSPDQFEILGVCENADLYGLKTRLYTRAECKQAHLEKFGRPGTYDLNRTGIVVRNGLMEQVYFRILIRHRRPVT